MTQTLVIVFGIVCLLIGGGFYWLNLNTPIQTRIPAFMLPVGAAALLIGLGRLLP